MDNTVQFSKTWVWAARIIMVLLVVFLAFDSIIHILAVPQAVSAFENLGFSPSLSLPVGLIELFFLIIFIIPRTRVFGALLLTGYLGGAVFVNLSADMSVFGNILFPVYVGVFLWGTVYVHEPQVRAVLPFKK